jgi:hypothetical protein
MFCSACQLVAQSNILFQAATSCTAHTTSRTTSRHTTQSDAIEDNLFFHTTSRRTTQSDAIEDNEFLQSEAQQVKSRLVSES